MIDVAQLLGSFADTVLGLGLPTLRSFLRECLGERAEVGRIASDGDVIALDDVTIPLGPRGVLSLERATFAVTARMPPLRLDAFCGTLRFGEDFHATIRFVASPAPDEEAWVWGELTIDEARWSASAPAHADQAMSAHTMLSLGSTWWRLDGGRLEGVIVRARFAGGGAFGDAPRGGILVPHALSSATVALESGKVGPICDALGALAGHKLALPGWLPLDAQLDGELSWTAAVGGRAELTIVSAPLRGTAHVTFDPRGEALEGRFEGTVHPAAVVRRLGVATTYATRDEDSIAVGLVAHGTLRRPALVGTFRAVEVGFRLGRPRFVPPVTLQGIVAELRYDARLSGRVMALAHGHPIELVLDGATVHVKAPLVDVAFARDVLRTLAVSHSLPDGLGVAVDLRIANDVVTGTLAAPRVPLTVAGTSLELVDVRARIRVDRTRVIWNALDGHAHGGTFSTRGVWSFHDRAFLATGAVKGIVLESISMFAGRVTATAIRGRLDGTTRARRVAGEGVLGDGTVVLHEGVFPVLDRLGPMLDRYGLTPPQQEATAPATATLRATEWGFLVEAIEVALPGATARGGVGVSHERTLEGAIEVTLADEYLKKSKVLTLPRVFVDRLLVPIKIGGTLAVPEINAEVGSTLGRALVDNRVTAWFGRNRAPKRRDASETESEIETQLDAILVEVASDWTD